MKALVVTLREEPIIGVTCWDLKSNAFKALMLPTLTHGTKLGNIFGKISLGGFKEWHEDSYDDLCQSVPFNITSYIVH